MGGLNDSLFGFPSTMMYSLIGTFVFIVVVMFFVRRYMRNITGGDLKASGESAQATIIRMWDTGTTVNDNPVAGFLLEVRRNGYPPYQVEAKSLVPRLMTGQFQPGATVPIKVDPQNAQRVALDIYG
ncbi:MAG TPA: hypothetical protein VD886_12605 [Herpetosiphonaceae bacterium]|nr:hypothetical protein [Herpetosiphonaceae bacterium]